MFHATLVTKDINDTHNDTSKELAEILLVSSTEILETELVSKTTARLFSFFGDIHIAKKFVDIIYLAKKKVENFEHKENPKNFRTSLTGEWWKITIENKTKGFIFKLKDYIQKDKPIKDIEKYWFQVMETLWEDVLLMEKIYGYSKLEQWFKDGVLELEEESSESRANANKLSNVY